MNCHCLVVVEKKRKAADFVHVDGVEAEAGGDGLHADRAPLQVRRSWRIPYLEYAVLIRHGEVEKPVLLRKSANRVRRLKC